jgi:alpha-beta hydrolase superfamily lysophospholipase
MWGHSMGGHITLRLMVVDKRNLGLALRRSVAFFDATVKNAAV